MGLTHTGSAQTLLELAAPWWALLLYLGLPPDFWLKKRKQQI